MVSLATSLSTVGISEAKGVGLVMQREQVGATMPRSQGAAEQRAGPVQLSPEDQRTVDELKQIDRRVREHEAAHLRAGAGVVTSGANYTYTYGPDGKQYAVGGEVGIDTSPEPKPQQNIDKGIRIQAAALAPRDPSPQDYRVASIGGRLEAQGHIDLTAEQQRARVAAAAEAQARRDQEQAQASDRSAAPGSGAQAARVTQVYGGGAVTRAGACISVFA